MPPTTSFRKLCWVLIALIPLVSAPIQGPIRPVALAQHSLGAAAVAIVALRIVEVARWTLADLWRASTAWLLLLDGIGTCVVMSLTGYFCLHHSVSFVLAVLCSVPFVAFWATRGAFERRLTTGLEDAQRKGRAPKPLFDGIEVLCPSPEDHTLVIALNLKPSASKALRELHRLGSAGPRSLALWIVIGGLAVFSVMLATAAADEVVRALNGSTSNAPSDGSQSTSSTPSVPASTTPTATAPPAGATTPAPSSAPPSEPTHSEDDEADAWNGQCTSTPSNSTLPQHEVEIEELYVGNDLSREGSDPRFHVPSSTGEPPGRKDGGCTLEYHNSESLGFVWAWGEIPATHRHLSIAIDSTTGPALFLEPAAQQVHALIERYDEVGGIRRFNAGRGDFYPVETSAGTYILIRREKGTDASADAYEVIPPSVAEIWVSTVDSTHKFLWPRLTWQEGHAVYHLDTNAPGTTVAYTIPYPPSAVSEPQVGEAELKQAAEYAG